VTSSYTVQSVQITPPAAPPPLLVSFQGGMLTISSNKASLSESCSQYISAPERRSPFPAGAEQEQVVAEIGPASAPEVLSRLLNGSKFKFPDFKFGQRPGNPRPRNSQRAAGRSRALVSSSATGASSIRRRYRS